jgi:hypothetical protein
MPLTYQQALDTLQRKILDIKPAGDDGFEGLITGVLAARSGYTFRLAKSGSQFGRDANMPPGPFVIAIEGKRYDVDELRLEVFAGKVQIALDQLTNVDVWVLGSTAATGADALDKVVPWFEAKGVQLVCLDWAPYPIPPLAVALAAEAATTHDWFALHTGAKMLARIDDALAVIAAHPAFAAQRDALDEQLAAGSLGLGPLRRRTSDWFRTRLTQPPEAQQSFGQIIQVDHASAHTVRRTTARVALETRIADALQPSVVAPHVIAVLGDEGTGKSWLVAQWWAEQQTPPVLIFAAGRHMDFLAVGDPVGSLASLLAQQDDRRLSAAHWRKRLERWRTTSHVGMMRFAVVVDGLNEHPAMRWGALLTELAREVRQLGGVVIATSRPAYWKNYVAPQIGADVHAAEMSVDGYDDVELAEAFRIAGCDLSAIAPPVRAFMRNPRVCSLGLLLLAGGAVDADTLTIERLLVQYWRMRVRDAQGLVHTLHDFDRVLRDHARAYAEQQRRVFDESKWADYSAAAARFGVAHALRDLTEIIEGRFLTPTVGQPGMYEFRPEVLPFALALLINDELERAAPTSDLDADEALQRILTPVAGFDAISGIVAAAVGLACWSTAGSSHTRRAVIRAWFALQNRTEDAWSSMVAHLLVCPDAFLDVAEQSEVRTRYANADWSLPDLLIAHRLDARLQASLDARLDRWLTRWSKRMERVPVESVQRQAWEARRLLQIETNLGALDAVDRAAFDAATTEVPTAVSSDVERLAVYLLVGRPASPHAAAVLGWCFVQWVAPNLHDAGEDLAWVLRCASSLPRARRMSVMRRSRRLGAHTR